MFNKIKQETKINNLSDNHVIIEEDIFTIEDEIKRKMKKAGYIFVCKNNKGLNFIIPKKDN